jgi:hypothetical protein
MPIAETSLAAYESLKRNGHLKRVQDKAYKFIMDRPGCTILDFELASGIKHQTASSAFSNLTSKRLIRIVDLTCQEKHIRQSYEITRETEPYKPPAGPSNEDLLIQFESEVKAGSGMFYKMVRDEILKRMNKGRRYNGK